MWICFSIDPHIRILGQLKFRPKKWIEKHIRIRRSLTFCKRWHFDWINGLVISKEKRTNGNITHLSIMDKLYNITVQEFIRAERISNWNLHVCATKSMVNLFAATEHKKHSKSCRLYLQFIRYQIWNRITQRFTKGFWKVLFKFLVNKTSAVTFCEAIKIFYWYTRQFVYSNSYVLDFE